MASGYRSHGSVLSVFSLSLALAALVPAARAQLSPTFYASSCPVALLTIRAAVRTAVALDARTGASLLRLHFHDCFCNARHVTCWSRRTDTLVACVYVRVRAATRLFCWTTRPTSPGRRARARTPGRCGFGVIDAIKLLLEALCPRTVSCADILAVAARDSVVALGGPSWTVQLGRRDSTTASLSTANTDLPSPASSLSTLLAAFARKGLSSTDMVALSGAHTVGQAQCQNFRARIYNDTNIDAAFAATRRAGCPATGGGALAPLDASTPNAFDNGYYTDLVAQRGLLHSDQELFNGGSTDGLVRGYAASPAQFQSDFAAAMVKMGGIGVLTGTGGQVRRNCRRVN
ncbi:hypothetical protein PR202_ga29360 [Eleusine coracana subsp. coracana]|uniref:Peroxidase n=1 Tax=Eleusine coracana subsp. coracana TaxID=191504 RepID=A0AAV5DM45_ELECO|nr:hypothetical protein PR202_ga29360 [Eleusine coracana subsp. coracana]